ncbi:MAG: heavy metal translocating P-type ATPase [Ardenticatenales bacterium]|nr:heavy metal translocating P-type ATPase [Ardenticatenales bacterium]
MTTNTTLWTRLRTALGEPASLPVPAADRGAWLTGPRLAVLAAVTGAALVAGYAVKALGGPTWLWWGVVVVGLLTGSVSGGFKAWESIAVGKLNIDVLMILAAWGAAAIGAPAEGLVLLFLFTLSEALQQFAMGRTQRAIHGLMALRPDVARRRLPSGDVEWVPVEQLAIGDTIVVQPGERIPADGTITAGASDVDASALTGESIPVGKAPGDAVFAASMNGAGMLTVGVTAAGEASTVARIIALVADAQASQAPTQRMIDRFGNGYAWAVIGASALMFAVPALVLGWPTDVALYRAMTLLVVASPCALVISTPATYLSAIARAARSGVLFKGGAHLEVAAAVTTVAVDKTGTLTQGRPIVTEIVSLGALGADDILRLAAATEAHSGHLIARAILAAATAKDIALPAATDTQALLGLGVEAMVDGVRVTVGRAKLFVERGTMSGAAGAAVARLEAAGQTVMLVARGDEAPLGAIAVADEVRPTAAATVAGLRRSGVRRIVMLTGDNAAVAAAVAAQVGIHAEDIHASLMPVQKVEALHALAVDGPVAFVGDGVNDAPALAAAALGVAMGGGGTDVAMETADVVLMGDRIERLVDVVALGRAARRTVAQNIVFSVGVIVILAAATIGIGVPLTVGVLAHEGSTVLVVLNGLRLLGWRA